LLLANSFHIPDHASDLSLFNLLVQATGADGSKLALIHISEKLNGLVSRIVHTSHDETIVEARDGIEDQESLRLDPALFESDCDPASVKLSFDHFEKNPVYDYEDGILGF